MQFKLPNLQIPKMRLFKLLFIFACIFFFYAPLPVSANPNIDLSNCPEPVKRHIETVLFTNGVDDGLKALEGTYVVGRDSRGNPIFRGCSNPAEGIEKLMVKVVFYLTSAVGLVFTFAVVKSAAFMMIASDNAEKFQEATGGLTRATVALIGVFISYQVIVFVLVGLAGVGKGDPSRQYNIVCQNQIVFNIVFQDQGRVVGTDSQGRDIYANTDPCK